MLIGIDANEANLTRHRVGVNQYAFDLLHALSRTQTEHRFVIYLKTPPLEDLPSPRQDWQYRVIPFPKLWTQTRLPFDLFFHFPRPDVFFSMTHYAPRIAPMPSVVAIMDLGFFKFPEQFTSKDFNQLKNWTGYSVRQAKKIIAISEHTKKDIVDIYRLDPDKIVVSYPGYDNRMFYPTKRPEVLKKYGITTPYYLFLSSLKPSKNVEGLIKAFSDYKNNKYTLVIAGKKAWLYDQIFSLVKQLNLEDKVVFTGFVDEDEVPVLMTYASAFVLPSFYEGFGIPVVESMACGTPVIVSQVASLPEVAGEAGVYVDPNSPESITKGLEEAVGPRRTKFVKAGLSRLKLFNWAQGAKQVISVLESAV
jgi:glycosyltransferase involved in cell wall biosynthesis